MSSVLKQTYKYFELIVVNDGSTDSSVNQLTELLDARIKLVHQDNLGVSAARNRGVAEACSEYVCFLDADDEWDCDFLESIASLMLDFPGAPLYSLRHRFEVDEHVYLAPNSLPHKFRGYIQDFFHASLQEGIVNSSNVAVSKRVLTSVGGFPEGVTVGEDLIVWIRLALRGRFAYDNKPSLTIHCVGGEQKDCRRLNVIPYPVEYYAHNKNELSGRRSLKKYVERIGLKHTANSFLQKEFRDGIRRAFALAKINRCLGILSLCIIAIPAPILKYMRSSKR